MKVSGPVLVAIAVAAAAAVGTVAVVAWTGAPHEHTEPEGPCPDIHFAREDVGNTTVYTVDEIRNGSYRVEDLWFELESWEGNWSRFSDQWRRRLGHPFPLSNATNASWYDYESAQESIGEVGVGDRLVVNRSGFGGTLERMDVWPDLTGKSDAVSIGGTWDCGDQPEGWTVLKASD